MAVKKHGVHFDVTAENATDRALRAVEQNLNGINKAADKVGRVLQGAFVATAAISAGKAFANAAMEAEQASLRLDAVLKATGHSAGLTKDQLDQMADSMAESTQFDDESLRNASAQMLKFGNIHGDTFRQAMKLSADLAAFMGSDLTSAVQQVGKALTSPAEGLGALEKQIGKFNPATASLIKALDESGRAGEAQGLVLDVLRGKIGGTAEALNTGLTKASHDAKKQWDEMLESIGKTEAFQKVAKSGLNFIEQSFRDIKHIVENGDWVEKTLAILAFAGGWRGMKLTPQEPPARNNTAGRIGGVTPPPAPMRSVLTKEEIKDFERQAAEKEKLAAEAKRRQEEQFRDDEKMARAQVDLDEETQKTITEAQEAWQKQRAEQEKTAAEDSAEMWKQIFETIDREQEDAIEQGKVLLDGLEEEANKAEEAARQLGLTFSSAFEDAILGGKKFSDVLKGLSQDVGRIILRKAVTEPLAAGVGDLIKNSGIGKSIGGWFGGLFKAEGGPVMAGEPYIVGERGPELFVPGSTGAIVPSGGFERGNSDAAGGIHIGTIDMRGASVEAVARLERMFQQFNVSFGSRVLGVVQGGRVRGMV